MHENDQNNGRYVDHIWTVITASSAIDRDTNSLSFFNVIEEITIDKRRAEVADAFSAETSEMVIPMQFELLTLWKKVADSEHIIADVEVDIRDPNGTSLQKMVYKLEIAPPHRRLRFRMKMSGFKVTTAGDYLFVLRVREPNTTTFREVTTIPVEVKINS